MAVCFVCKSVNLLAGKLVLECSTICLYFVFCDLKCVSCPAFYEHIIMRFHIFVSSGSHYVFSFCQKDHILAIKETHCWMWYRVNNSHFSIKSVKTLHRKVLTWFLKMERMCTKQHWGVTKEIIVHFYEEVLVIKTLRRLLRGCSQWLQSFRFSLNHHIKHRGQSDAKVKLTADLQQNKVTVLPCSTQTEVGENKLATGRQIFSIFEGEIRGTHKVNIKNLRIEL